MIKLSKKYTTAYQTGDYASLGANIENLDDDFDRELIKKYGQDTDQEEIFIKTI